MESSNANARRPARSKTVWAVGLIISAVSLAGVLWWASNQAPPTLPSSGGQVAALLAALAAYSAATSMRAERWLRLLRHNDAQPSRADCYALTAVGYMGNNVLPARAGDGMRIYLMAPRARTSMRTVAGTLIAERLLDVFTLLALFFVLAFGVLRGIETPSSPLLTVSFGLLCAVGLAGLVTLLIARRTPAGRRMIGFIRPMTTATRRLHGRHGVYMSLLTIAIWSGEALTYLLVGDAVGLEITPIEALYLVALTSVFLLIPSGPGYLGTLDAAVLFGAQAIGATGGQAISYLLMLRFVLMVPITLVGLALLFARYGGRTLSSTART